MSSMSTTYPWKESERLAESWSAAEIDLIVADYMDMLVRELRGEAYNKAEHYRQLKGKLNSRSKASFDMKHQNISAIMLELGAPYIDGFKPLPNYQRLLLPERVKQALLQSRELAEAYESATAVEDAGLYETGLLDMLTPPPKPRLPPQANGERPSAQRAVDYLAREALNQRVGRGGEELVLAFERQRLISEGASRLADKVEHVAATRGDGDGFDILSFDSSGRERWIEAKTTVSGKDTPFYFTPNELNVSHRFQDRYWVYRVYCYGHGPRLYQVPGSLRENFLHHAVSYMATGIA